MFHIDETKASHRPLKSGGHASKDKALAIRKPNPPSTKKHSILSTFPKKQPPKNVGGTKSMESSVGGDDSPSRTSKTYSNTLSKVLSSLRRIFRPQAQINERKPQQIHTICEHRINDSQLTNFCSSDESETLSSDKDDDLSGGILVNLADYNKIHSILINIIRLQFLICA